MAWIHVIQPQHATGELAEYYRDRESVGRRVSNVQKAISMNPSAMAALDKLQESFEERGALSAEHREMIATVTSALNRCHY